jgi:hypothetical protein
VQSWKQYEQWEQGSARKSHSRRRRAGHPGGIRTCAVEALQRETVSHGSDTGDQLRLHWRPSGIPGRSGSQVITKPALAMPIKPLQPWSPYPYHLGNAGERKSYGVQRNFHVTRLPSSLGCPGSVIGVLPPKQSRVAKDIGTLTIPEIRVVRGWSEAVVVRNGCPA